jgi:putative tricarboxylic transport membrane protein
MADVRPKRPGESTFGIIMLLLSLFLAWQSYEIAGFESLSSPGAFPMAASAVMVIAAVIVVIGDLRKPHEIDGPIADKARSFSSQITPTVVVVFTGCVVGYSALLDALGFLPASFLFLLVAIQFLHNRSFVNSVLVSILSLIAIYVVFRLIFTVVLPEGIVPEREIIAAVKNLFVSVEAQ